MRESVEWLESRAHQFWHGDVAVLSRLTSDSAVLSSISSLVGVAFSDVDNFTATEAFIATWENVVPYTEGSISVRACSKHCCNKRCIAYRSQGAGLHQQTSIMSGSVTDSILKRCSLQGNAQVKGVDRWGPTSWAIDYILWDYWT